MGISGKLWVKKWVKCGQMILKMGFSCVSSHYVLKMVINTHELRKNPKIAIKTDAFFLKNFAKKVGKYAA